MLITRSDNQWHFESDDTPHITLSVTPHFFIGKKSFQTHTLDGMTKVRLASTEEYMIGYNIVVPIHVYEYLEHECYIKHPVINTLFHTPRHDFNTLEFYEQLKNLPFEIQQIIMPHCQHLKNSCTPFQKVASDSLGML